MPVYIEYEERDSNIKDEKEEKELLDLAWKSSRQNCIANRKHKHLAHLFEATHTVCVQPSINVTVNQVNLRSQAMAG